MTRRLLIDCGAAATVGALLDGDEIVQFAFAPARGDEAALRAASAGDIVLGRIRSIAPALGGAFVEIGAAGDAFLPIKPARKAPPEGASVIARVRRPALAAKGAVLDLDWSIGLAACDIEAVKASAEHGLPRIVTPPIDAAAAVARWFQPLAPGLILVNRPEAARALCEAGFAAQTDERAIDEAAIDEALDAALSPVSSLGEGARMIVDETAGGAVIDIDSGNTANATRTPNDRVNERAARRLFRELARRSIGGRVVVDFLPPTSPAARRRLLDILEGEDVDLYKRRIGKLAPDGFFDMTAPRRDLTLLERASEPFADGLLRPGRGVRPGWAAQRAMSALEMRLRRFPRAQLALEAGTSLARFIEARPQWLQRATDRYGARFVMRHEARLPPRGFNVREI